MIRTLLAQPTRHLGVQLIRYGMVVAVAFPIDFGLLYVFTAKLHLYYVLSATLAFTISMVANYLMSITWVFQSRGSEARTREITMFAVVGFVGLGLTDVLIWLLTSQFKIYYLISKLIAITVVFFWSFGARRYLFQGNLLKSQPQED